MNFYAFEDLCLCPMGGSLPENAAAVEAPFVPLVFLLERDPAGSRGIFAVRSLSEVSEPEGPELLLPSAPSTGALAEFVAANGAVAVNTAFANWYPVLRRTLQAKSTGLRLNLVGLGDVGGVNKQLSEINLLFVKLDVKVAAIMGVSILLGALIMSLFWGFVVIKQRFTIANLRYKLKQIEKNEK